MPQIQLLSIPAGLEVTGSKGIILGRWGRCETTVWDSYTPVVELCRGKIWPAEGTKGIRVTVPKIGSVPRPTLGNGSRDRTGPEIPLLQITEM